MTEQKVFEINFYDVLGLELNASSSEIRKAYATLSKKYHPDKAEEDEFNTKLFELVQRAWETLGDQKKKAEYDFYLKNEQKTKNNDHDNLKKSFETFLETQDLTEEEFEKKKSQAKIDFERENISFDKKHKIDRKEESIKAIDKDEMNNRFEEMMLQREQDTIEYSQKNLFENRDFNLSKFNAAFDMYKDKMGGGMDIVHRGNVSAYNGFSSANDNYTSLNNFGNFYEEGNDESGFARFDFGKENRLDINIDSIKPADYTSGIGRMSDDEMKRKLAERESFNTELDTIKDNDFMKNDFFKNDKNDFRFLHEVGINNNTIEWNNEDEVLKELIGYDENIMKEISKNKQKSN